MPVVRISLLAGRTKEQKAKIVADVTKAMIEHAGSTPEHVNVIFDEQPRENWGYPASSCRATEYCPLFGIARCVLPR